MSKKPITAKVNAAGWSLNIQEPLVTNLRRLYSALVEGRGNEEADRSLEESRNLLAHTLSPEGKARCRELEALKDEDLLARRISLWVEAPKANAADLAEAKIEFETSLLWEKDAVQTEIHRRQNS
jgi:hypothetical protein